MLEFRQGDTILVIAMIIYELECAVGHHFEGWFPSPQSFEQQQGLGLVHCSVCGIGEVRRVPAGGHVGHTTAPVKVPAKSVKPADAKLQTVQKTQPKEMTTNVDPVTLLKMVDHYIRKNFQDVGKEFAKTAIAMHEGEKPEAPIFGSATPEEKDLLETKGIAFSSLPKLPESTEN